MDKIVKQQILLEINSLEVSDLLDLINARDISVEEMVSAGLEKSKLAAVQKALFNSRSEPTGVSAQEVQDEIKQLCEEIERDEHDVMNIRSFLLNGVISPELLKKHTSINEDLIEKINYYQKQDTDFNDWSNLPTIQLNRSDIFFFGQPGSGKSCVLGSLFYLFEKKGLLIENMTNMVGTKYRNQLSNEFSYGILPDSTAVDGVNYMPIELRNLSDNSKKHPLNFVEMSGEMFDKAYEKGLDKLHPRLIEYLKNKNRKIIFFVIDYDLHKKSQKFSMGPRQSSKMTSVLELLDQFGTLEKVDSVYVLVTKSDLFPQGVNKTNHAKEFMEKDYLNFINNLKDKKEKYKNKNEFKITIFPYSIGKIRFKNLLVNIDLTAAETITRAIQHHAFVSNDGGFFKKFFN